MKIKLLPANIVIAFLSFCSVLFQPDAVYSQERVVALPAASNNNQRTGNTANKPTALGLPFFADFTTTQGFPSPALWNNQGGVYISNTMSGQQFSRGMAVFDANKQSSVPYDTLNPFHTVWADSLTSQPIDLSTNSPSDSLWLSFYYEPGGNGFLPKPEDSLILFFYNSQSEWVQVWETGGDTAQAFKRIMIPVNDTGYFTDHFAFRFVNKATHGISNSNWNLDYVLLNKNRHYNDTAINDIAFTTEPTNLLNDFTAMPYNQFKTNPARFLSDSLKAFLKNNGNQTGNINYGYQAKELLSGTNFTGAAGSISVTPNQAQTLTLPAFDFSNFNPLPAAKGKVVLQTKYFTSPVYPNESLENDTIVSNQVFDNYFAYDDGTAEEAYFLNLFPNAPGITAIENYMYLPDTLRGVSIYFPRTVPPSGSKEFSLIVYKSIAVNGGTDQILYQQDYYLPEYQDSINKFYTYRFDQPVAMDTGTYYIGIMQDAGGFSDSLYIGLDVNRTNGNHRYFNVDGSWQPSLISGALLVRPVAGAALPPTGIQSTDVKSVDFNVFPNPTRNTLNVFSAKVLNDASYTITDMLGRELLRGRLSKQLTTIDVHRLHSGVYIINILSGMMGVSQHKKFIRE